MSTRNRILGLVASIILLSPLVHAQYVPVVASHVQDASGVLLANGSVCMIATDDKDIPIKLWVGPAGASSGNAIIRPVCSIITNGAIVSLRVADPATSYPLHVLYRATVRDEDAGTSTVYKAVAVQGPSFNWDTYLPPLAPVLPPYVNQVGPQGSTGPQGAPGGLSGSTRIVGVDLNNVVQCGTYDINQATNAPPDIGSGWSKLLVICTNDPVYTTQIAYHMMDTSNFSSIRSHNAGGWSPWQSQARPLGSATPASSSTGCTNGQTASAIDYFYVCVADNTWRRAALSNF